MHESLRLYDASLALIAEERNAIDAEDEERLGELCEKRTAYMEKAWEKRAGCDPAAILERLEAIRNDQMLLTRRAQDETEIIRMALQNSRKENTRLAGYGKVVNRRQSAFIVSKEG